MLSTWRIAPSVVAALLVVVWSAFSLGLAEASESRAAALLGYQGEAIRIVVIPAAAEGAPDSLSDAIVAVAADHALSIAYSRSPGSGMLTLLDDYSRFANSEGSLGALVNSPGGGANAAISSALANSESWASDGRLPSGIVLGPSFSPDVMFDDIYPAILLSTEVSGFEEGVYLIAGETVVSAEPPHQLSEILRTFEEHGMSVVGVFPLGGTSVTELLAAGLRTPFGIVAVLFTGLVLIVQLLIMLIFAGLTRHRLLVASVLGATRSNVRTISFLRSVKLAAAGLAVGVIGSMIFVLATDALALSPLPHRLTAILVSLVAAIVASTAGSWVVAMRESRKVSRAVPI